MIHMGQIVNRFLEEKGYNKSAVAKSIKTPHSTLYNSFKRPSWDSKLLYDLSKYCRHDFFQYYKLDDEPGMVSEPRAEYLLPPVKRRLLIEMEGDAIVHTEVVRD